MESVAQDANQGGLLWKLPQFSHLQTIDAMGIIFHGREPLTGNFRGVNGHGDVFDINIYDLEDEPQDLQLIKAIIDIKCPNVAKPTLLQLGHTRTTAVVKEMGKWSLYDEITSTTKENVTDAFLLDCVRQVATALSELQSLDIIIPDLSPKDIILIDKKLWKVNILDTNSWIAKTNVTSAPTQHLETAPPYDYQAPEVLSRAQVPEKCLKKSVLWSFGVMLHELLFGKKPTIVKEFLTTLNILTRQRIDKKVEDVARDHFMNAPKFSPPTNIRPISKHSAMILSMLLSVDVDTRADVDELMKVLSLEDEDLKTPFVDPLQDIRFKRKLDGTHILSEPSKSFELSNFGELADTLPVFEGFITGAANVIGLEIRLLGAFIINACQFLLLQYTRVKAILQRAWIEKQETEKCIPIIFAKLAKHSEELVKNLSMLPENFLQPDDLAFITTLLPKLTENDVSLHITNELRKLDALIGRLNDQLIRHIISQHPGYEKELVTLKLLLLLEIADGGFKYINCPEFRDPSISTNLKDLLAIQDIPTLTKKFKDALAVKSGDKDLGFRIRLGSHSA